MPVPIPVPLRGNSNTRLEAKYNVITEFPSFDLHSAAATGNMGLVEYALQRGQPINSVLDGVLPLHAACAGGNEQVVKLLIDHGADVNAPRLPRRYSNEKNRDASAPIVGTSGSTPLHFAAANGNTSIITMLLLKGAHADRADKHGITPEQLAMQNGWLQSAELLRNWAVNKDRDLRERKPPISDDVVEPGRSRHGSFGFEGESSRRLRMKQSVDHALNMLKSPSSGLSEAYSKPTSSTNTPPTSPTSRAGKQSLDTDRPSSNGRRPSLGSPHATSTKGFSSPRRPRSAGTGAEERNSPKGSTKKLTTKYSLLSLFKKSDTSSNTLERTESYPSSVASLAPSPSISSPRSQPIPISTSPRNPDGFGTSMTGSPSGLRHQMESANSSPGHSLSPGLHRPSAVDLHNVLARQQEARRDRSGSSSSRIESIGLGLTIDSTESPSSSPPARRPRAPSQLGHSRHRSGSANRNGTVFDDELIVTADKSVRPSILRAHNRSSSSGQGSTNGVPNLRALRFHSASNEGTKAYGPDGHSLRPCNSTNSLVRFVDMPEEGRSPSPLVKDSKFVGSAPPTVLDFNATTSLSEDSSDDDEEDYGRALERRTRRASANRHRGQSFSSIISDVSVKHPDFPFSIREAPPSGDGASIRQEGRGRGDSLSSTTSTNPNLSVSGMTSNSGGSVAATPPQSSPRPSSLDITSASPGPKIHVNDHDEAELDVDEGEPEDVNQMPIQDPNPHAQAEARVQRAQQDILAHVDEQKNSSSLPLSARLAAYGESLAKLRELQAEAEAAQTDLQNNIDTMNGTGSRAFNRQRSMDALSASASNKVKRPRRPHTSSGASSSESILSTASGPSHQTFRPNHTTARSISDFVDPPTARLPAGSLYNKGTPLGMAHCLSNEQLSRVNSSEGIETDTELGPTLCRVSTAPQTSVKSRREQARNISTNKLNRMGFSRNDMAARTPPPPPSNKRFGGLKSLLQPFKAR